MIRRPKKKPTPVGSVGGNCGRNRSKRPDFPDLGDQLLQTPLDPVLHRGRRDRAGTAEADQTQLYDTGIVVETDELHVPAVLLQSGTDRIEPALDPFENVHRFLHAGEGVTPVALSPELQPLARPGSPSRYTAVPAAFPPLPRPERSYSEPRVKVT